jgi:uncharacterized membrane protein YhaH (DUF805 family)
MSWYFEVLKKYAVFDGRAQRKEYWMFVGDHAVGQPALSLSTARQRYRRCP